MQLSILIVNYNVRYFLEQCLYSVQAAVRNLQAEVIVIDNNSTDGSLAYLQPFFPWVKWIANKKNTGFGVANNQALAEAKGEYILFLNPDTLLPEDCLEECLAFMQMHPQTGALGIKMLDGSGRFLPESKRGFPSPLTSLFKLTGLAVRFPNSKLFAKYHLGHISANENSVVDVLAGAFMLVRHAVLQQVGAFDERFFMYGEDIDLSYRIQKAGWQNWYYGENNIIHFKGESTKKGSLNYVRMFYQAMNLFVQKHYSGSSALLYRWLIQSAIAARAGVTVAAAAIKKARFAFKQSKMKSKYTGAKMLVLATVETAKEIETLIQSGSLASQSVSYAEVLPGKNNNEWEKWDNSSHQQIVFGIDQQLNLETAINLMQELPAVQFGFHFKGSSSIISSSSKNDSGSWIAA